MVSAKFHFFQKLLASRLECLSPKYTVKKPRHWRKHGVVNIKKPLKEQDNKPCSSYSPTDGWGGGEVCAHADKNINLPAEQLGLAQPS